MHYDVIVIGGSYAGMAAALQLVRARKSVLVIDAGERRNRFASHSHGFLGQDGVDPGEIAANARRQLEAYPTLSWLEGRAEDVSGEVNGFTVTTAEGKSHHGRRILLAIGVADQLPPITGLDERWGKAVFHCPYCHGYELGEGRIGIIATGPMSLHQAQFLTEWGDITLLVNNAMPLGADARSDLKRRGVVIEEVLIDKIEGHADVRMADGRLLSFAGLFTAALCTPSHSLAEAMGCAIEETPMGLQVRTDAENKTSVPGVFACGDVARVPHSVSIAVGNGALAGIQIHRSLFVPETVFSVQNGAAIR
ncbi:MAG: NAD(P)/FAD-dependent oxidoreductase [Burkholderiaceae bacterium]|jgi:thioredoxin reductase|nr:NAD(P)/FAD-dependent oxidoreductase [Burkholderiaceae bacterium]